ncbi:putative ubiquitin-protein ligase e3 protein [Neofusicoccum parvum UCRNP2]|uniref:Putative ubiquitin-protein ligase e3 protein n=1 Tax=Botryosphaeria parva (strain UCR-NP2) TaxID=1287680 RepID=R1EU57_BOTPV|nr:putative ubiquitin-protein ligase e3 protein [Neofusicoccum parvum UCRNP2]
MEAAIRWSPHSQQQSPHFIVVDVAGNRLRLCEVEHVYKSTVRWKQLAARDKLPNFTAFDWSKTHEHFVAIGSASGEASLLEIDAARPNSDLTQSFPIKHQRKCNSIAFSTSNLLATGLDRVRNDFCMNIYDLNVGSFTAQQEPYKKLASSEAITSIKFFPGHPQTLVAGVSRQCIRIYDLRAQYGTRQVHNLAIDPLDENYIISAGPTGDPTHYTRYTHNLHYPWYDPQYGHDESIRVMAFDFILDLSDTLKTFGVAKRRAKEGYCLDCKKNKQIVANDPWLVGLWELVQRLDDLAKDDGMVADGVDLSYLGVAYIWENSLGGKQNGYRLIGRPSVSSPDFRNVICEIVQEKEYPPFQGVKTQRPEHRQLCLAICGWTFSAQRIRENCKALIEQGQYYKAIVLAVFKGHKDIALDFLKQLVRQRLLQNIGLGAVIACDTVNKDQRELCEWMAEETEDPYLKALLQYFITGNWETVAKIEELSLVDRVGVALKYLDDDQLTQFIKLVSHGARVYGDIEGIVFTGLGERAMDLFEHNIAKFGDVQTAVLVMARTNPLYVTDPRWDYWKDTYFMQMQTWRCFIERTRFIVSHNKVAKTRDGHCLNKPFPRQITIRCMHCQLALARRGDSLVPLADPPPLAAAAPPSALPSSTNIVGSKPSKPAPAPQKTSTPSHNSGLVCPRCGRRMPRCGICMMWLGSPDPATIGGAESLKDEDHEARQMVFCMTCTHGFHGHHARDWFAKHKTCPVPDCQCMCGLLR